MHAEMFMDACWNMVDMLVVFAFEWRRGNRWNKIDYELVIVEIMSKWSS